MPTLIVENVPSDVYERLQQRAAAERQSVTEHTLHLLEQVLREEFKPAPRLPDFMSTEEIPAPCDLPRSSQPVRVTAGIGRPRRPDPIGDETPP